RDRGGGPTAPHDARGRNRVMMELPAALVWLAAAPVAPVTAQQQPAATTTPRPAARAAPRASGPRLTPEFRSYQPAASQQPSAATSAAATDRVVISISTLGLIILGLVLILLPT